METYNGLVRNPQDAILLFEACRIGLLPRVQRRLSEKERQQIKSGSVFVWDEREAGMRRWTDGKSWSASRVSGSFLTYREMEGKRGANFPAAAPAAARKASGKSPDGSATGESDGEGPDGYRYKPDGLVKASFSITTQIGQHLHLISYCSREDQNNGRLQQPTQDAQLRHIRPPKNMYPESSVNETTPVPAVTRAPMNGSPYTPAQQQMGSQSPYPRAGPSPQTPILVYQGGPPTPPYQHQQWQHQPMQVYQPHVVYYAQMPGHPQVLLPPQINNQPPPHNYPGYAHPPQYQAAQYISHPQARIQAAEMAQRQAQVNGQQNGHRPPPLAQPTLPEQGPVLPALNGIPKPSTPQSLEAKSSESLSVPDANGAAQTKAPSPGRNIPSLGTLLNNTAVDNGVAGTNNQSHSRAGSRSPNHTQRPPREMGPNHNAAADTRMVRTIDTSFLRS